MSLVTTEPAPMTQLSPIVTPGQTMTPPPSHTLSPIVMGSAASREQARGEALVVRIPVAAHVGKLRQRRGQRHIVGRGRRLVGRRGSCIRRRGVRAGLKFSGGDLSVHGLSVPQKMIRGPR